MKILPIIFIALSLPFKSSCQTPPMPGQQTYIAPKIGKTVDSYSTLAVVVPPRMPVTNIIVWKLPTTNAYWYLESSDKTGTWKDLGPMDGDRTVFVSNKLAKVSFRLRGTK